ncbi:hypothetical protein OG806_28190 [Streptomyces sp. NBC_00882]|uniref:hypothetical protein n=1 Tax=Streptomyces TaxID=1883 RepID=UPI00386C839B|nr:hypothetical protein OG806_28190 [Streptomyces sp. NBC_00882]WSZ64309.1 hypothetical protein OH824_27230 [Streptomyces canus]
MSATVTMILALTEGGGFAGWARPAGVLVGAVLAWRRAPFVVVVLGAAGATAGGGSRLSVSGGR